MILGTLELQVSPPLEPKRSIQVDTAALHKFFRDEFQGSGFDGRWAKLVERVGAWATLKGWRSEPRGILLFANNLHGELAEAWEEFRGDHHQLWFRGLGGAENLVASQIDQFLLSPEAYKPEGLWVEIADFVIRCADTVGEFDLLRGDPLFFGQLEDAISCGLLPHQEHMEVAQIFPFLREPLTHLDEVRNTLTTFERATELRPVPVEAAMIAFVQAEAFGVNLWNLIDLKMLHNDTRAARHGGKVA